MHNSNSNNLNQFIYQNASLLGINPQVPPKQAALTQLISVLSTQTREKRETPAKSAAFTALPNQPLLISLTLSNPS